MSQPFPSACMQNRRRRAPRRDRHAARQGADAGLHAGGHARHGEGADPEAVRGNRRRDRARQYLSSDAAARRRAHRRARRPAQIHELAARDPHRLRRLPGDVAVALRKLSDKGVIFRSHLDGAMRELSPERAIEIQALLGADISMQLDECLRLPAAREEIKRAMALSLAWGERSKRAFEARARDGLRAVRHRAGRRRYCFARRKRAGAHRYRLSTVTPSAGWRWASRRMSCSRSSRKPRRCCRPTVRAT